MVECNTKTYIRVISQQLDTIDGGGCKSQISDFLSDGRRKHWRTESESEKNGKELGRHDKKLKSVRHKEETKDGDHLLLLNLPALYATALVLVFFGAVA